MQEVPALDPYRETWRGKRTEATTTETEHSFDELPSMTYCAGLEARMADQITKHPLHIDPIAALKRAGRHNDDTADLSVGIAAAAASSRNGGGKRPYPAPLSPVWDPASAARTTDAVGDTDADADADDDAWWLRDDSTAGAQGEQPCDEDGADDLLGSHDVVDTLEGNSALETAQGADNDPRTSLTDRPSLTPRGFWFEEPLDALETGDQDATQAMPPLVFERDRSLEEAGWFDAYSPPPAPTSGGGESPVGSALRSRDPFAQKTTPSPDQHATIVPPPAHARIVTDAGPWAERRFSANEALDDLWRATEEELEPTHAGTTSATFAARAGENAVGEASAPSILPLPSIVETDKSFRTDPVDQGDPVDPVDPVDQVDPAAESTAASQQTVGSVIGDLGHDPTHTPTTHGIDAGAGDSDPIPTTTAPELKAVDLERSEAGVPDHAPSAVAPLEPATKAIELTAKLGVAALSPASSWFSPDDPEMPISSDWPPRLPSEIHNDPWVTDGLGLGEANPIQASQRGQGAVAAPQAERSSNHVPGRGIEPMELSVADPLARPGPEQTFGFETREIHLSTGSGLLSPEALSGPTAMDPSALLTSSATVAPQVDNVNAVTDPWAWAVDPSGETTFPEIDEVSRTALPVAPSAFDESGELNLAGLEQAAGSIDLSEPAGWNQTPLSARPIRFDPADVSSGAHIDLRSQDEAPQSPSFAAIPEVSTDAEAPPLVVSTQAAQEPAPPVPRIARSDTSVWRQRLPTILLIIVAVFCVALAINLLIPILQVSPGDPGAAASWAEIPPIRSVDIVV